MIQIRTFSDNRLDYFCNYCGNKPDTRDHIPSKILLDEPFPENLPVVPSCSKCNEGFSLDEEYFACLLECTLHGTTNIERLEREKIKRILSRKKSLQQRLANAIITINGNTYFKTEEHRIRNVILKLAKGHAKYENSESQWDAPISFWAKPIITMSKEDIDSFFSAREQTFFPEVGSRALQKVLTTNESNAYSYWINVQTNNYSYSVSHELAGLTVRIIIWEYMASEIIWQY